MSYLAEVKTCMSTNLLKLEPVTPAAFYSGLGVLDNHVQNEAFGAQVTKVPQSCFAQMRQLLSPSDVEKAVQTFILSGPYSDISYRNDPR